MYCEKCGNKLDDDSKFCDKCGTVIETTDNIKKSKDNVFKKFILPLILVTLFIILIFIGANLILNKHNEKSEEYKQEINEELDKKVIATYNGGKLTDEEFEIYYKMFIYYLRDKKYNESEIPKIVVNKAIIDKLVLTESHKNNIKITQEQEKELNETFESEDFKNLCVNNNIDNEKLKELYRNDYIITNYIEEQAKNLSDSEVITYLKNKYGNDVDLYQYTTQTIMFLNNSEFTAEQNAISMLNYIKQGADFTEMAKLYSEDEGTRDNGGIYICYDDENTDENYFNAIKLLTPGDVNKEVVTTGNGYAVVKLVSKVENGRAKNELDRKNIINERLDKLSSESNIVINDEALNQVVQELDNK